jgi:hypothetical protein
MAAARHGVAARAFLALSGLVWLPYGVYCFVRPQYLGPAAGVTSTTATGTIELRAMYGGLQVAIGVLALLAAREPGLVRPALVAVAFLCGGLALSRLAAALMAAELSAYTAFALAFEWLSTSVAFWLLARATPDPRSPAAGYP